MNTTIITPERFKAAFDQIVAGYENQIIKYRFNDFTDKRRQMVIFGNFDDKGVMWRYYVYNNGEFEMM